MAPGLPFLSSATCFHLDLRSQTLCHSVSRVLTHSLWASWVASIHIGAVLATQLQLMASSSVHLGLHSPKRTFHSFGSSLSSLEEEPGGSFEEGGFMKTSQL